MTKTEQRKALNIQDAKARLAALEAEGPAQTVRGEVLRQYLINGIKAALAGAR